MRPLLLALLLIAGPARSWSPAAAPDHASAAVPPRPAPAAGIAGPPNRPLVVVDPGHGGHDPGSTAADGTAEKTVTLALARAIRDAILETGAARVALTRDADRWVGLATRREVARAMDAALFLSIHCDSTADPAVHGASLYTLATRPTDPAAGRVAARENRADDPDGADLPALLTGLAEREARADARRAVARLAAALAPSGVLKPDWARAAQLKVLRAPDVPAVLVEAGYLSNPADRRRLTSAQGRHAFARDVATAVQAYLAGR